MLNMLTAYNHSCNDLNHLHVTIKQITEINGISNLVACYVLWFKHHTMFCGRIYTFYILFVHQFKGKSIKTNSRMKTKQKKVVTNIQQKLCEGRKKQVRIKARCLYSVIQQTPNRIGKIMIREKRKINGLRIAPKT